MLTYPLELDRFRGYNMISEKEVAHVARLARLDLDQEQVEIFAEQLNTVLEYVEMLGQVDTTDVDLSAHGLDVDNVFREDRVRSSLSREKALENAPEKSGGFFKVPRVI